MLGRLSTVAWTLFALTACGMTRVGSTETDIAGDGGVRPQDPGRLCPSAGWDPSILVAAGFDGNRLVAIDGSGARRVPHTFAVPAGVVPAGVGRHVLVESNRFTAVVAWNFEGADGGPVRGGGESVRFDRTGDVIWHLEGSVTAPSDSGAVMTTGGIDLLARADGTLSPLPASLSEWTRRSFMTAPDGDGWMLVLGSTETPPTKLSKLGLVNLDGERFIELPTPTNGLTELRTIGGKHVYLAAEADWTLTFASPAGARTVDLAIPVARYASPLLAGDGRWAIVVNEGRPVFRVDVDAERVVPIDSTPIDAAVAAHVGYPPLNTFAVGQWVLGAVDDEPVWLVDGATGKVDAITLERLAPLRHLEGSYCNNASLPDQGLIALGLRDEALAGFYAGNADGTGWTRIGRPYRDVQGIWGHRVANTWVLQSASGKNTYCPGFRPFAETPESGDAIVGDATQIVPPNAPPLVFPSDSSRQPYSFELDPTGMCALQRSNGEATTPVVLDLRTARSVTLDGIDDFVWLSD